MGITAVVNTNAFPKQDYVTIDGNQSPGICTIRGAATPRTWKKNQGYGASGGWLVFTGNGLTDFEIDFYMMDEASDPDAWKQFADACLKKAPVGQRPKAVTIEHPILTWAPLEITQCVVTDVGQPEQDELGGWHQVVKFTEFRSPVPISVKVADIPAAPEVLELPKTPKELALAAAQAHKDASLARSVRAGAP